MVARWLPQALLYMLTSTFWKSGLPVTPNCCPLFTPPESPPDGMAARFLLSSCLHGPCQMTQALVSEHPSGAGILTPSLGVGAWPRNLLGLLSFNCVSHCCHQMLDKQLQGREIYFGSQFWGCVCYSLFWWGEHGNRRP